MNFDDVHYLAALWECRHVGRAAQALGLTQPALSRALARFEAQLGVPLFERTPKGLVPTPAGEAFARRMLRVRSEISDAVGELDQMRSGKLGALRVGYSPNIDEAFVLSTCRQLICERPAARLSIVSRLLEDLARLLMQGDLDLIVAQISEPVATGLHVEVIYEDRLCVVADRKHPLLRKERVTLADVALEAWVAQPIQIHVRRLLDKRVSDAGLPPLRIRIESDSNAIGRLTLLRGTSLLTLHSSREQAAFERLGLRVLDVADLSLDRQIGLMRRREGYVSPLATRLAELLTAWSA
ncbi:MAG: LysR family transcriptional regulator [Burkholderiales bacterium]